MSAPERWSDHLAALKASHRADEAWLVAALIDELTPLAAMRQRIESRAAELANRVRDRRHASSGVDQWLQTFALSSQEGVALLCLAEALLRIPDTATRDQLIRDTLARGDWGAYLGKSESLFVNAGAWGLLLTGRFCTDFASDTLKNSLLRCLAKGGEAVVRAAAAFAMTCLGQRFVIGETIAEALANSHSQRALGFCYSFDMLGEAAQSQDDAERYTASYLDAINVLAASAADQPILAERPSVSIKLSALSPHFSWPQHTRAMNELYPRLAMLVGRAAKLGIACTIDAEECERLELALQLFTTLCHEPELATWPGLGFVVQAYQKRALPLIDALSSLAERRPLMVRLVKGAYWDSEIKRAQVAGSGDFPVFTQKAHSDVSYLACAKRLLASGGRLSPQFATHNAHTLAVVEALAEAAAVDDYEFQCLYGMGESLYSHVVSLAPRRRCRIYAPVGAHRALLPYLVRRLLENGANSSFVHNLVDPTVSIADLIADPIEQTRKSQGRPHPLIRRPSELYTDRQNAAGLDLTASYVIDEIERRWQHPETISVGTAKSPLVNPADRRQVIGHITMASADDVGPALARARASRWQQVAVAERAACLLRAADAIEADYAPWLILLGREAGKTWAAALAEVRETVDFCRYYSQQAQQLSLACANAPAVYGTQPVAVAISPWNFPLAIFVGQVAAALVAGYAVVAKAAEQTPLVAWKAVQCLHAAGVPSDALCFLPGQGETVGAALVAAAPEAVLFTGSTAVAHEIADKTAQAARPPILIAETGGVNALLVDASAQLEQVVADVLVSAFDSAGQRCSALRLLCVQDDIAEPLIGMLQAAMAELTLGNPRELSTEIGPVIDERAQRELTDYLAHQRQRGARLWQAKRPRDCDHGYFVPPTLIEIDRIDELTGEVFGPIVHVVRIAAADMATVIDPINALGYGLTFGLHSRLTRFSDNVIKQIRVGNIYLNRNMVGAVVGLQPFGGEGRSGTGPKAGGPLYLARLMAVDQVEPATLLAMGLKPSASSPFADLRKEASAAIAALDAWLPEPLRHELPSLAALLPTLVDKSLVGLGYQLAGPVGEDNSYHLTNRGAVLATANTLPALVGQLAAAWACANRVVIEKPSLAAMLPTAWVDAGWLLHSSGDTDLAAVLVANAEDEYAWRQKLASRSGPIIPLIVGSPTMTYPLYRLVAERSISHNTAAAGGAIDAMLLASYA